MWRSHARPQISDQSTQALVLSLDELFIHTFPLLSAGADRGEAACRDRVYSSADSETSHRWRLNGTERATAHVDQWSTPKGRDQRGPQLMLTSGARQREETRGTLAGIGPSPHVHVPSLITMEANIVREQVTLWREWIWHALPIGKSFFLGFRSFYLDRTEGIDRKREGERWRVGSGHDHRSN